MHKTKLTSMVAIFTVITVFLTGCQSAPQSDVIVSKKNSSFDIGTVVSVDESQYPTTVQEVGYKKTFESTDESVRFVMDIKQTLSATEFPLVQVTPHYLTEEDAEHIAYALFPGADFYEAEPLLAPALSKREIQDKINLWSQYTNADAIYKLYGDSSENFVNGTINVIKNFIEKYTLKYETAPEGDVHEPCAWEMRKSSEYMYAEEELAEMDMGNDNDEISAQFNVNGIPYYYTVSTRNKEDFRVNMISCILYGGESPRSIEDRIFSSKLCNTPEPSADQVKAVTEKVTRMLSDIELGQWEIDECKIEKQIFGSQIEYHILVNAVPVFNGVPALRRQQLESLRDQNGYAASQYFTDANFNFSANGELIAFRLYTPLEVEDVINQHVRTMDINALLERAEEVLKLTDAYAYSFGDYLQFIDEDVLCNVSIVEIEPGLSRLKVQDREDSYYYVPALVFRGNVEYVGAESGKTYYVSEEPEILLHINAVDGSLINATNS